MYIELELRNTHILVVATEAHYLGSVMPEALQLTRAIGVGLQRAHANLCIATSVSPSIRLWNKHPSDRGISMKYGHSTCLLYLILDVTLLPV